MKKNEVSIESAKNFVETPGQKYKDTDLLILFKEDYFAKRKKKESKIKWKVNYKLNKSKKKNKS